MQDTRQELTLEQEVQKYFPKRWVPCLYLDVGTSQKDNTPQLEPRPCHMLINSMLTYDVEGRPDHPPILMAWVVPNPQNKIDTDEYEPTGFWAATSSLVYDKDS